MKRHAQMKRALTRSAVRPPSKLSADPHFTTGFFGFLSGIQAPHTPARLVIAIKIARDLNAADIGTHYSTRDVLNAFEYVLRNM